MSIELTKDQSTYLVAVYKMYLDKIKDGQSKSQASNFESGFWKNSKYLMTWHPDDISQVHMQLSKIGLFKTWIMGDFVLQPDAIFIMENRFKNGLKEVVEFLTKFIP
ncbi:hypothetical protein G7059_01615 [Erysipelothrix sp. HDW6A]|uniref:hypothetical protein n=1 Tax=Erysipelothrix sp. HDW6A TaxID=2714928 RepID=UPI00140AF39F|nr:hypothetical protein [Erysipelothrix sp. HDW6A]QIK56633.1 hypothetical protein G7059_01615 [Erysipelothrix sp. HDW6A]